MKDILIKEYNNLSKLLKEPLEKTNKFNISFVNGAKCEITGDLDKKYTVKFTDQDTGEVFHEGDIHNNMWTKTNIEYFKNWKIEIQDFSTKEIIHTHCYNSKDKRVYIHFASKALGDTLAWFPFAEEFRKKHKCKLLVSTFHNQFFESEYPEIEFIEPATTVYDLYAMYEIGWHYNEDGTINEKRNPTDFKTYSLQSVSAECLGVEMKETKPKVSFKNTGSTIEGDYICIAPHASAHAKYWNYKNGWQTVINYFNKKGYKVVMITQEPLGDEWHDSKLGGTLTGVIDKTGNYPLSERANDIMNAKAYIGLGSGLSWISWVVNTPTVLISGFSEPYSEFEDCERITTPKGNCTGCFNRSQLDAGDWEWCPDHKDTDRHFECTKTITPKVVIDAINRQLEKSS